MIDGPLARLVDLPYRAGAALHRGVFLSGLLPRASLDRFTISVGSLHFGGAGKTPLALDLLTDDCALLMKGYRGEGGTSVLVCEEDDGPLWGRSIAADGQRKTAQGWSARFGDEAVMAAAARPGIPVGVGADRVASSAAVLARHDVGGFVLDDAFSHHRLRRDRDLLIVPVEGAEGDLAGGLLREGTRASGRADAVIFVSDVPQKNNELTVEQLTNTLSYGGPRALCRKVPAKLWNYASAEAVESASLAGAPVAVVCALGRPGSLVATAQDALAAEVVHTRAAADHHRFGDEELDGAERAATACGARFVLTTAKDAVRIPPTWRPRMDWIVVETCLRWDLGEDTIRRMIRIP